MEAQNEALEGLCRPEVADSHHFDEKQIQDPELQKSEKRDPDPY
jgi:hypothetical protein